MLRYLLPAILLISTPAWACGAGAACTEASHKACDSAAVSAPAKPEAKTPAPRVDASQGSEVFKLSGLSCQGCAKKIAAALKSDPAVTTAAVDFATGKAVVTFHKDKITADQLRAIIEKAGFTVEPATTSAV